MAANAISFRNYLTNTLNFPAELTAAIVSQGYTVFDDLSHVTDDEIDDMCIAIRRPGGQIPDPNHVGAPPAPLINNPGCPVGQNHVTKFKQLAYFVRYMRLAQRTLQPVSATLVRLRRLHDYKVRIKSITADGMREYPEPYTTAKKARDTIEDMDAWIANSYGLDDLPLSYVVRVTVQPPLEANDVAVGQPTWEQDLIRRASHQDDAYGHNNELIWLMIRHVTHGTDA